MLRKSRPITRERPVHEAPALIVELGGFEPPTLSMPWRCATSCAIAPNEAIRFMGVVRPAMNQRRNHQMHADGFVVELGGFEPPTLSMPWRCATSCAIAPFSIVGPLFGPRIHYDEMSILAKAGVSPNGKSGIWRHFLACFRHYSGIGLFNYCLNGFSNTLNLLAQQGSRDTISVRVPTRRCRRWPDRDCSPADASAQCHRDCPSAPSAPSAHYAMKPP